MKPSPQESYSTAPPSLLSFSPRPSTLTLYPIAPPPRSPFPDPTPHTNSQNSYSSGVKEGKWVEDLVGMDLARNPPNHPTLYTTEQREKMIHPRDMENR